MADLGEVRTGGDWRQLLRFTAALGALLAGALALTAGGAKLVTDLLVGVGLPMTAARQIAIATVSTIPPVVLAATLVMTNENARARLVGLAGVAISLTGIAVGLPLGFESAAVLVASIYIIGLFFLLSAVVHGLLDTPQPSSSTPGWTRNRASIDGPTGAMPADGGDEEEDDDLNFLLESEEDFRD